ncbi:histidyl-tRNA ligase HisZ [Thermacetogenium phaeum DSM 12270]|uniref:ATP phosphoribosyltransferase regulatory subunit n=1 Tax=Thermacetogenium phaeum (strain ATCC BAA-254 / DSM 26808 / PB) TaxID=1089553 RepID=K4LDM5_THEPS|nr:ATP phosphoribosyltransferase regulatory subunit [Thermacetogenium phaeum]AFV11111.1 histidyl-tRNA ligase HisZ [Thermacetogenium phaeum DSM 12270]
MDSSGMVLMPGGVRDLLPGEARRKRELENRLIGLFRSWGYQEVVTPTFEYYDVLAPALGKLLPDQLYRFIDEQGRIMVLRPDMTTPIARMMSTRLQGRELPQRYCYAANVFRRENHAGRQREFFQAGVELLGAGGPAADAEVISLAAAALELAGIKDFRVAVGHVEVLAGVLRGAGFSEAEQEQAKIALGSKDLVAWERLVLKSLLPQDRKKVLASLPYRNGGIEVLERVRDLIKDESARASLESLSRVWESLADFGFQGRAGIDLTLLRGLEYYTGIVFECYAAGVGYPLCGGGRYDCLLSKFGPSLPATGFALVIDRLLAALERQSAAVEEQVPDYFITGDDLRSVFQKAKELREEGFIVEVDVSERPRREAIAYASRKGIPQILVIENSETVER